jgi:hypothetical protein
MRHNFGFVIETAALKREKEQPETLAWPKPRAMRKNRRFCLIIVE